MSTLRVTATSAGPNPAAPRSASALRMRSAEVLVDAGGVGRNLQVIRFAVLVDHIGADEAGGAVHRSRERDHHLSDAEIGRIPAGVHRTGAAEGEQHEGPRVVPLSPPWPGG